MPMPAAEIAALIRAALPGAEVVIEDLAGHDGKTKGLLTQFAGLGWSRALIVGGAAAINFLTKLIFHRVRPHLWPSLTPEADYSFPSGHALISLAVMVSLLLLAWPTRWRGPTLLAGGFFVLLVGLSRLYLGVHYPTDVLAGWAAGGAWCCAVLLGVRPRLGAKPM